MPEPVIRVENITRTFVVGDVMVRALRGVDLTIEAGEFVAIMGSSGSGKSTLMSILGCLDRPTSGHYFFEGIDVAGLAEPDLARIRSERLGFVFQSFNLLARTSAVENVALPLYYAASGPVSRAMRIERARTSLGLLGLSDRERNTPGQLSGGQQQRVAIARALINAPRLLLADEPTGNLDTRTSHEIMDTLVKLNREKGVTIVVVTHEADVAAYASRIVTMRDGEIASDVPVEKPTRAPLAPSLPLETAPGHPTEAPAGVAIPTAGFWTFGLMILAGPGGRAQQDALGAHHAGSLHRRRRADRDGRRGRWRQRGCPQADRESRHQSRGDPAGRRSDGRGARRRRQCPPYGCRQVRRRIQRDPGRRVYGA